MRALITGSRGFLGSHLTRAIREDGRFDTVVGISRKDGDRLEKILKVKKGDYAELNVDITDRFGVYTLMENYRPEIIFHFAANPIIKPDPLKPNDIIDSNIMGTYNLLTSCVDYPLFVFASSAAVYGDVCTACHPAKEFQHLFPTSVYGATKVSSEALISAFTNQRKICSVVLRLVANVGKGATHGIVKDLVYKLKSDSHYLELFGNRPGTIKPFMHVEDTVSATIFSCLNLLTSSAFRNVSLNDAISVEKVAYTTMAALGIQKEIRWLGKQSIWAGDNQEVVIDNSRLISSGWKPKYKTSEEAIFQAVKDMTT